MYWHIDEAKCPTMLPRCHHEARKVEQFRISKFLIQFAIQVDSLKNCEGCGGGCTALVTSLLQGRLFGFKLFCFSRDSPFEELEASGDQSHQINGNILMEIFQEWNSEVNSFELLIKENWRINLNFETRNIMVNLKACAKPVPAMTIDAWCRMWLCCCWRLKSKLPHWFQLIYGALTAQCFKAIWQRLNLERRLRNWH